MFALEEEEMFTVTRGEDIVYCGGKKWRRDKLKEENQEFCFAHDQHLLSS